MIRQTFETGRGPVSALIDTGAGEAAPWLHFGHATGMHAAVYQRLLAPLSGRFNLLAHDARGHGRSLPPPDADRQMVPWAEHAEDTAALLRAVAPAARWWLAGHSFGAVCALIAATEHPGLAAGIAFIEPPLIPFAIAAAAREAGMLLPNPLADQAERRRGTFPDRATARAAYAGRGVFRAFADADLDAYLEAGLVDVADGVALACAPAFEAATFRGVALDVEPRLARLDCPLVLLAGSEGSTVAEAEFAAFAAHPCMVDARRLEGHGHFLTHTAPEATRAAILRLCAG